MLSKNNFKESQLTFFRGRAAKVFKKGRKMVTKGQNMGLGSLNSSNSGLSKNLGLRKTLKTV